MNFYFVVLVVVLGSFSSVNGDCWWTGCQADNWAVVGCEQYGMVAVDVQHCNGGKLYHCCDAPTNPGPGPGEPDPNPGTPTDISYEQFSRGVTSNGYPAPSHSQYNSFMSQMSRGRVSSKQEAAMVLAQLLHESGGLVYKREIACAQTFCPEHYRTPGCDAPGRYYYGRGYIQLTWCYNYIAASQDLYGDVRLVNNPDQVADIEDYAWATAFWYWSKNVHDNGGATGQFGATTNAINGGLECVGGPNDKAQARFRIYGNIRAAFGLAGAGDPSGCWR